MPGPLSQLRVYLLLYFVLDVLTDHPCLVLDCSEKTLVGYLKLVGIGQAERLVVEWIVEFVAEMNPTL